MYRKKGGKKHVGYSLNLVEDHSLSNEIETLSVDGAYYRVETVEKAKEKDIEMNFSQLTGRSVQKDQIGVDQFTIDTETNQIVQCPAGQSPVETKYNEEKDVCG